MTTPTITTTFDPPSLTDSATVYQTKALGAFSKLGLWAQEANALAEAVNTTSEQVALDKAAAESAKNAAQLAAQDAGVVTPARVNFLQPGKNLFNKADVTQGSYLGHDNVVVASSLFAYTLGYIAVTPGTAYYGRGASHGMRFVTYYSSDKTLVAGGLSTESSTFTPPMGIAYVRITCWVADLNTFQLEVGSAATSYQAFGYTLQDPGGAVIAVTKAAVADSVTPGGVGAAALGDRAVSVGKVNFLQPGKNLFNKADVTQGYFLGHDNVVVAGSTFAYSGYIAVTPGTAYYGRGASHGMRFVTYYSAGKSWVAGGLNAEANTFTPPAGVAYVRITCYLADLNTFQLEFGSAATSYQAFGYVLQDPGGALIRLDPTVDTNVSAWDGVVWASLGDSTTANNNWQPTVLSKLGLLHTNLGVAGTKISGSSNTAMCNDARVNAIPLTSGLVTVLGGINDWAQNTPMGDASSVDVTTFSGALNVMMGKITTRVPTARVVLMTTSYGELLDYAARGGWANAYTNALGLTTRDYAAAMRAAAVRWGVPVADVANDAGWNTANIRLFVADDGELLHPNAAGALRIANLLIGRLRNL